jgi:hypothetical protein
VIRAQDSQIINAGRDVVQTIDTGGGAYVGGGVNLNGGDFVGRDKVVYGDEVHGDKVGGDKISGISISGSSGIGIGRGSTGFSVDGDIHGNVSIGADADEIERLFQPVLQAISHAPQDVRAQAVSKVADLKTEAAKGDAANDGVMAGLLNEIKKLVPEAAGALVQAFASPLLQKAAGDLTQLVLNTFR